MTKQGATSLLTELASAIVAPSCASVPTTATPSDVPFPHRRTCCRHRGPRLHRLSAAGQHQRHVLQGRLACVGVASSLLGALRPRGSSGPQSHLMCCCYPPPIHTCRTSGRTPTSSCRCRCRWQRSEPSPSSTTTRSVQGWLAEGHVAEEDELRRAGQCSRRCGGWADGSGRQCA